MICVSCGSTGWEPDPPPPETWRNWAVGVDLKPWHEITHRYATKRVANAKRYAAYRREQGKPQTHKGWMNQKEAQTVGACGEIAVSLLLGGRTQVESRAAYDIETGSGGRYEVKTSIRGWPFVKWPPSFSLNKDQPRVSVPYILCATQSPPECFDQVFVVGIIDHRKVESIRNDWRYSFMPKWPWQRIELVMAHELNKPWLPIGAALRRSDDDAGFDVPSPAPAGEYSQADEADAQENVDGGLG